MLNLFELKMSNYHARERVNVDGERVKLDDIDCLLEQR